MNPPTGTCLAFVSAPSGTDLYSAKIGGQHHHPAGEQSEQSITGPSPAVGDAPPVALSADVTRHRFPQEVKSGAYFVACEALAARCALLQART